MTLKEEIASLRTVLAQERSDHGTYIRQLKNACAEEIAMARQTMMIVRVVCRKPNNIDHVMKIIDCSADQDGVSVVVTE